MEKEQKVEMKQQVSDQERNSPGCSATSEMQPHSSASNPSSPQHSQSHAQEDAPEADPDESESENKSFVLGDAWIRSVLLRVYQEIQKQHESTESTEEMDSPDAIQSRAESKLESDLCYMWDSTRDDNTCKYFMQCKETDFVEFLLQAIHQSAVPRLVEIFVGILANMCCFFAPVLTEKDGFVSTICTLLSNVEFDSGVLTEAMRTATQCLFDMSVREQWTQAICNTQGFKDLLFFVLQNCKESRLLHQTGNLLEALLCYDDQLCEDWASADLVSGMTLALKEMGQQWKTDMKPYLTVFHSLSTTKDGAMAILGDSKVIMKIMLRFVDEVCDEDVVVLQDHVTSLSQAIAILNFLLESNPFVTDYLKEKPTVMANMLVLLESMYRTHFEPDNPARLPTCLLPDKPSDAAESDEDVPGSVPLSPRTVEIRARHAKRKVAHQKQMRIFHADCRTFGAILQEYFYTFFEKLKLERYITEKHHGKKTPSFLPVLEHLNKREHRFITYLVSILVYTVPPREGEETSEASQGDPNPSVLSHRGLTVLDNLRRLCAILKLKKAAQHLNYVPDSSVSVTAGGNG